MSRNIEVQFPHRTVTVTVDDIKRWAHPAATAADIGEARRAFRMKDSPEALAALRELVADIARHTPGAQLFTCLACGCDTYGATDVIGPEVCEPCYQLAGLDNECNDNGRDATADERAYIAELLADIEHAGGDAGRALASCDYLPQDIAPE